MLRDIRWSIPMGLVEGYDPEILEFISGEQIPEELKAFKKELRQFLKQSSQYYSIGVLANFLGTSTETLRKLMTPQQYRGINSRRAQTILVLKPLDEASEDYIKYQAGLI